MNTAGGSNIGQRKDNEDQYEIRKVKLADETEILFLVIADGMGGHEHGQLASKMAVEQFSKLDSETLKDGFSLVYMRELFQNANAKINAMQEHLHDGIMGTTMTAAAIQNNYLFLGHVGDSRCYIYRDRELIQLSVDHTYYAELIRHGQEVTASDEKQKNVLMKALGPELSVEGQFLSIELQEQDLLILCTDGLYNAVTTEDAIEICENVFDEQYSLDQAVDIFLNKALSQGARDNLTLVVYWHGKSKI